MFCGCWRMIFIENLFPIFGWLTKTLIKEILNKESFSTQFSYISSIIGRASCMDGVWYGMVWQAKCSQWILIMTHKSNDMWTPLISSMGRIFWSLDSAIVICSVRLLVCFFSCFFVGGFRFGTHETFKLFHSILFFLLDYRIDRSFSENWLGSFSFIVATYMCIVLCPSRSGRWEPGIARIFLYDHGNERSVERFNLIIRNCF